MLGYLYMYLFKLKKVIWKSGLCNVVIVFFNLFVFILSDMLLINFCKKLFFDNFYEIVIYVFILDLEV